MVLNEPKLQSLKSKVLEFQLVNLTQARFPTRRVAYILRAIRISLRTSVDPQLAVSQIAPPT